MHPSAKKLPNSNPRMLLSLSVVFNLLSSKKKNPSLIFLFCLFVEFSDPLCLWKPNMVYFWRLGESTFHIKALPPLQKNLKLCGWIFDLVDSLALRSWCVGRERERRAFSRVVWSPSIPVKSPKCPSRRCIINIPEQLWNVSAHLGKIGPVQWRITAFSLSDAHAAAASNAGYESLWSYLLCQDQFEVHFSADGSVLRNGSCLLSLRHNFSHLQYLSQWRTS